jgi:hypothetical protein
MENMAELYLEKANIECDDSAANEEDRKMAGAWFKKSGLAFQSGPPKVPNLVPS